MAIESWKSVVGYEGLYEVSDLGRVRSLDRYVARTGVHLSARYLKVQMRRSKRLYPTVGLSKSGVRRTHYVHVLVLQAFVGPRPDGYEACHGDGNNKNFALSNLRWDTPENNRLDKVTHGTVGIAVRGEANANARLTAANVTEIVARRKAGESGLALSRRFRVSPAHITAICKGRTWRHLALASQ